MTIAWHPVRELTQTNVDYDFMAYDGDLLRGHKNENGDFFDTLGFPIARPMMFRFDDEMQDIEHRRAA